MECKIFFFLYFVFTQAEAFASVKGQTSDNVSEDLHTYRANSESNPTNLTCFSSTKAKPLVFIHEMSSFLLVLNAQNENKGHGYLCRRFTNRTDLLQQYKKLVVDVRINETVPIPILEEVVRSCIPIPVLMPILAVAVVSVLLNIHLLFKKRQRQKRRRAAGLKAIEAGSGSDESLLARSSVPGIVVTENHHGNGSHDSNEISELKNDIEANTTWLHSKTERRRRLGSTNSPLEDSKPRTDTISEYKIPKIGFEDGPVLPPQTSHFGRVEDQYPEEDSSFQPALSTKKVPYYPVLDEISIENNSNEGFQSSSTSNDDLSKPNGTVKRSGYQAETGLSNQKYLLPESNNSGVPSQELESRGIGFHLPETDDDVYEKQPPFNNALGMSLGVETTTAPAVQKGKDESGEPEISAVGGTHTFPEGCKPELDTDDDGGFQPDRNLFGLERENVPDDSIPRIDNDSGGGFQPEMSLIGRDDFQPVDDVLRSRADSRGFQYRPDEVRTPSHGIPSFYNDDNEGFQPSMSLSGRDDETPNDSIPRIDNFGFQPERSLRGRDGGATNDDTPRIDNFGFQSKNTFEPGMSLRDLDETQEGDLKTDDSFSEPLEVQGRGRSNTIEEYNIPTVPFGEDSVDMPVVSASAAMADHVTSEVDSKKEDSSIVSGVSADDKDSTLNTDSFA